MIDRSQSHYGLICPEGYAPRLDVRETSRAIKLLKDEFEDQLADTLNLTRVSAPLFVRPETGLNDNLNGVERPVAFDALHHEGMLEVVQSLAKWKRMALARYGFTAGEGLYTDMNAIRRDEFLDNMHSVYVDQWDWELILTRETRTHETLQAVVREIFHCFRRAENRLLRAFPGLPRKLPAEVVFITAQELADRYPELDPKAREDRICQEYGAVFIEQIGGQLRDGRPHDGRAPDYDDWDLNGDLIFWYPMLNRAFEVSSMGIRVDAQSMDKQLQIAGCMERAALDFHRRILNDELPLTIGGGIGQSRICMYFLDKAHIGEVQASWWPNQMVRDCQELGIVLL